MGNNAHPDLHVIDHPLAHVRMTTLRDRDTTFVCLVCCPEGLSVLANTHSDVSVYTASVDDQHNDCGYILPGLGDVGDRYFGTL